MQLRHLRYFVKIVEAGSFSRAAATIHVAQPALSQQIAELEEEMGLPLLHRSARGIQPTPAGEVLYREAIAVLQQMDQLPGKVRSSAGVVEGVVNLGMTSTLAAVLSGPFMETCRSELPKVALRFSTGQSYLLASRVEARNLDLGVVFEDEPIAGLARQCLFRQRLFLIRRDQPSAGLSAVSLTDLAKLPLVLPARPNVIRAALDPAIERAGLVPNIVAEADSFYGMLAAVQTGVGTAVVPKGDLSDVPGYEGILAAIIEPPIYLTASIVMSKDAPLTGAGEAMRSLFTDFVANWLADNGLPGAESVDSCPYSRRR
jgi:LysR family transcriptional regulator, nitrogen assimilation regulatory protein